MSAERGSALRKCSQRAEDEHWEFVGAPARSPGHPEGSLQRCFAAIVWLHWHLSVSPDLWSVLLDSHKTDFSLQNNKTKQNQNWEYNPQFTVVSICSCFRKSGSLDLQIPFEGLMQINFFVCFFETAISCIALPILELTLDQAGLEPRD